MEDPEEIFLFANLTESADQEVIMQYCYFIQHITFKIYGVSKLSEFHMKHQGMKSIFDLVTPSDEAYAMFVFINGYEFWNERVKLSEEEKRLRRTKEESYTVLSKRWTDSKKNPYAEHGFKQEGVVIYDQLLERMVARRRNRTHWQQFLDAWNEHCNHLDINIGLRVQRKKLRKMMMNHQNQENTYL